jgi:hypothetical protein
MEWEPPRAVMIAKTLLILSEFRENGRWIDCFTLASEMSSTGFDHFQEQERGLRWKGQMDCHTGSVYCS